MTKQEKLKKIAKRMKISESELKRIQKASPRNTDWFSSKKIAEKNLGRIKGSHSKKRETKYYQDTSDEWSGRKKGNWVKYKGRSYHSGEEPNEGRNLGSYMNPFKKKPKKK